jgi:hypothetical protein
MVDSGCFRQGKDIDAFRPVALFPARIDELLLDGCAGDDAGDGEMHVGGEPGSRNQSSRFGGPEEQRPLSHVLHPHRGGAIGALRWSRKSGVGTLQGGQEPHSSEPHEEDTVGCRFHRTQRIRSETMLCHNNLIHSVEGR